MKLISLCESLDGKWRRAFTRDVDAQRSWSISYSGMGVVQFEGDPAIKGLVHVWLKNDRVGTIQTIELHDEPEHL